MMNLILTAAAAATATAVASGPAGWIVLGIGAAIAVAAVIIGYQDSQAGKKTEAQQKMDDLLNIADDIKKENGIQKEENSMPKEEDKWSILNNGLTGESTAVKANDRAAISKGNIIDNYMNGERSENQSQAAATGATSGVIGWYDRSQFYYPKEESKPQEKPNETPIGPEGNITEDDETSITPPPGIIDTPGIEDKTEENLEQEIPNTINNEWERWYKLREEQWAREDAIRKETQEREDTAYQRAIADMKKAGLNPNLIGINPAESGGGITQASMPDMSTITNQMNIDLKELQQLIEQNFQGNENDMDRLTSSFTNLLSAIAMIIAFKK